MKQTLIPKPGDAVRIVALPADVTIAERSVYLNSIQTVLSVEPIGVVKETNEPKYSLYVRGFKRMLNQSHVALVENKDKIR